MCVKQSDNRRTHLDSHRVYVDLLVEVIEQRDGLNDHRVDLVGRELELEPGQRVTETEAHRSDVLLVHLLAEQRAKLSTDASVQVERRRVGQDVERELLGNRTAELRITDNQRLRCRPLALGSCRRSLHLLDQEVLERLAELAVGDGSHVLDRCGRRSESMDRLELEKVARLVRRLELAPEVLFAQFAIIVQAEETVAH